MTASKQATTASGGTLEAHQPAGTTLIYGRPVGVIVASLLLLAAGVFLAVVALSAPRPDPNPMLPATMLVALLCMATALGAVTRRTWARWTGVVLGLLTVLLGSLSILILTLFATGMSISLTSELYTGPATFSTLLIVGGLITVVGLARSGGWYRGRGSSHHPDV